jgi:signal transduction histidine kinase
LKNKNLDDQANREGMVETEGYFDLRAFTLKIIGEFEALATDHARRHSEEDQLDEISKRLEDSISKSEQAVHSLKEAVQSEQPPEDGLIKEKLAEMQRLVEETRRASEKHKEAYTNKKEELEREKDTLANLASLGILTVCFGHEAKEFCNLAAVAAVELKETYQAGKFMVAPSLDEMLLDDLDIIIDSTKFIKSFAAFSLGNVNKEKRKKGPVNIPSVAGRVILALNDALARQNISVEMKFSEQQIFVSNSYEIDWESIFINMLSNSIWAMTKTPANKRKVVIAAEKIGGDVEVRFKDSGCGLERGTEKYIFNPMYSTRRDDKGNTVGTGMGLAIVNTFITEHSGGRVTAYPNSDLGGAEFVITVPSGGTL